MTIEQLGIPVAARFNGRSRIRMLVQLQLIVPIVIYGTLIIVGSFAPLLAPYSPYEGELAKSMQPPSWAGGDPAHFLGTDSFGRDILSRLIYGARISLVISLLAVVLSGFVGASLGLVSGYFGGKVDRALMWITDVGLSLPLVLIAIVFAATLGPSFKNIIIVISLLLWPRYARNIRAEALTIKEQDFIALARTAGASPTRIMLRHIVPSIIPTLMVLLSFQVGHVILLESTLSFLGVGIPAPEPSWGVMVADGRGFLRTGWWISLFPGIAIVLVVLSWNVFGDWLRDHLDPKLRQI